MRRERRPARFEVHDGRIVLRGPVAADEVVVLDVDLATGAVREAWIAPAPTPTTLGTFHAE